jgi:hypothetical protein
MCDNVNGVLYPVTRQASPTLTSGSVPFVDTNGNLSQDNANLFYDNTNDRLGIGLAAPSAKLHVNNTSVDNSFLVGDDTNPDTTPFMIDNAGSVCIGTLTPKPTTSGNSSLTIVRSANGDVLTGIDYNGKTPTISLYRAAGTESSPTGVVNGNQLASINFGGYNSTIENFATGAQITSYCESTPVDSHLPSSLRFVTCSTGTGLLERMRIDSQGNVGIGTIDNTNVNPLAKLHVTNNAAQDCLRVDDSVNDASYMVIDQTGNVGIRSNAPTCNFEIGGSADGNAVGKYRNIFFQPRISDSNGFGLYSKFIGFGASCTEAGNVTLYTGAAAVDTRSAWIVNNNGRLEFGTYYGASVADVTDTYTNIKASYGRMIIDTNGNIGIGTNTPNASSLLDLTSTSKGFLPPRMTTTQKNAISTPATGLMLYDTTLNKLCVYTGAAWETITSA